MASPEAAAFYGSREWKAARDAYRAAAGGLCERCLKKGLYNPGEIVHHRIHLTPELLRDPAKLTAFENLELLCRKCHGDEHGAGRKRYHVDALGRISPW